MKILSIFGTRPEAIKMAPVVKALEAERNIESKVCVTAQHREMLDQVLQLFSIKPDYDLNVMTQNQGLTDITRAVLKGLKNILDNILLPYQFDAGEMTNKGVNKLQITQDVVDNGADPVLMFKRTDAKKQQNK